jgi:hypothetical protein
MPMKSFRWMLFVAPFLIASLANAAAPPAPEASLVLPAAITGAVDASACPTQAAGAALPSLNPASHEVTALKCGSCSVAICQGVTYNSICQGGTQPKHCIAAYGNLCTGDTSYQCQCWSGPLP